MGKGVKKKLNDGAEQGRGRTVEKIEIGNRDVRRKGVLGEEPR